MKKKLTCISIFTILILVTIGTIQACSNGIIGEQKVKGSLDLFSFKTDEPTQPDQPTDGPGSSNYSHFGVRKSRFGFGGHRYWIFEPFGPEPESAPLIVFNHGFTALNPIFYRDWIHHLVKRGNIVVYPRYQSGIFLGFNQFNSNAINAVKDAIRTLQNGNHVLPELDKFAITGHSLGGGITANMASQAAYEGLPIPQAIMPVQPYILNEENADFANIPAETLMLVVVGENDTVVGNKSGKIIFENTTQIPLSRKDFIIQVTDTYGEPDIVADHRAPVCLPFFGTVDAMDYYSTWKLFDALTDYAFYGINEEYCLGNTPKQRFMGLWSDGNPVKELIITDNP